MAEEPKRSKVDPYYAFDESRHAGAFALREPDPSRQLALPKGNTWWSMLRDDLSQSWFSRALLCVTIVGLISLAALLIHKL